MPNRAHSAHSICRALGSLLAITLFIGCSGGDRSLVPHTGGKTLIIGTSQEPDSLIRIMSNLLVAGDIMSLMWRRLMEPGPDGRGRCAMCTELPTLENGLWKIDHERSTSEAIFHLRRGRKWADGVEITAKDATFAWELKTDSQYEYGPTNLIPIAGVDALDNYTIRVRYSTIWPFADSDVRVIFLPEHYYRPIWTHYKNEGGTYWERFVADDRVSVKPLVNGPFQVEEWVSGSHILLERNPNYNLTEPPNIDRVLVRIIPDLNTLAVNVKTRQLHLTDGWLTLDQAKGLTGIQGLQLAYINPMWLEHATLQINKPPLDNRKVRQALLHAIDRDGMNEAIFRGRQPRADSWLAPYHPAYSPNVRIYEYDPAESLRLLAEAGWTQRSDGSLVDRQGEQLNIMLVTIAGDKLRAQVAEVIQAQWSELGIDVRISPQSARLLFSDTLPKYTLPAGGVAIWRWVVEFQDAHYANTLWKPRDEHMLDQLLKTSPWGRVRRNIELIEEAVKTVDPEQRYALLREQQEIWTEQLPILPIYWHVRVVSVDERLQGYDPHPFAQFGWNVEQWDIQIPDGAGG